MKRKIYITIILLTIFAIFYYSNKSNESDIYTNMGNKNINIVQNVKEEHRSNSFELLGKAFNNSRGDFWVSIQGLLVITVILAIIFYIVEHKSQPKEYKTLWRAFVWAITRYIGDTGHFAGKGPITLTGRYVDTIIGVLKILIFAVPAGLLATGFKKAMDDEKREMQLIDFCTKVHCAFRREQNPHTLYKTIPISKSVVTIQADQGIDTKDIIDAVKYSADLRLRNMATTYSINEEPQDRLVVEMFPLTEGKLYGCYINRKSNITIVSTSSSQEIGTGNFAYYLALYGGFNYISKEIEEDLNNPTSYYNIDKDIFASIEKDKALTPIKQFIEDIKGLAYNSNHWVIFILSSSKISPSHIHFVHKYKKELDLSTSVIKEDLFLNMYKDVEKMLINNDYQLSSESESYSQLRCDLDKYIRPAGPKNIAYHLRGGEKINAFTIRLAWKLSARDNRANPIECRLAEIIANHIGSKPFKFKEKEWKSSDEGFPEY